MARKGNIQDIYPLTPMQEGMLFHTLYEKSPSTYLVQTAYRLHGELNISYVEKSLNELFKRYDILRTVFIYEGRERPLQVVLKERKIDFYFEDLAKTVGTSNLKKEEYIKEFIVKDRQHFFDLTKDVLMRVSILQTDISEYVFIWSHHHILMDGWCGGVLVFEFSEIYYSYLENRPHRLPKAKQFKTYIEWLEKQHKNEAKNYWKKYLENYEAQAAIPFMKLYNNNDIGCEPGQTSLILNREKTVALRKLATRHNTTLNTLIQAVWGIILGKYNDRNDVVYGAVVSGRPSQLDGVDSMIGIFINTIPIRIHYEEKTKFKELLRRTHENGINSEPYHHYPLVEIQTLSLLKRNLFDHIIVFENFPIGSQLEGNNAGRRKREDFKISNVEGFVQINYDFSLEINPNDQLTILFNYNSNVYEKRLIKEVANHFREIFRQILNDEEIVIGNLTLLSPQEKRRILYELNDTEAEYPKDKTIQELFAKQVEKTPHHAAVVDEDKVFTYKEINGKVNWWSWKLRSDGIGVGEVVAIMVDRSPGAVIGILGILKAGAAFLPIDPQYPDTRKKFVLEDSEAKVLITQKKLFDKNKLISPQISLSDILFLEEEGNSKEANNLETICTPGDLAYIIYTSGTSGKPKGAMIQHRGLVNYIWWASKTYIRNENLNFPLYTSISFDLTITSIFTPLITGNTIIVYREQERDFLLEKIIDENRVGVVKLTPSHLKLIREKIMDRRLSSIKCFIVGGESLEYNLAREIHRKFYGGIEIYNEYGPTETVVGCMVYRFNPAEAASQTVPIGKPINNTRIYILDKEMNPVPFGVPGELYVSGDGVCRGYLKRKELNLNKFMSNPFVPQQKLYRTGDIVWMRADGTVEFLGRIDNQVKIRGFRIELGEIENQILQHDGIKDVVVTARKNEDGDVYLCAYVVAPQEFNVTELRKYLAGELPDYMIPPFFSQLDRVPLTPNGKVDLKALDAYDPHLDTGIEYEAPGNDTEELITAIWKEVLHLDKIGVHDNFFDVGGHSLNIIRISGKLKKNFGREIPVVSMFRYPTIRSLANHLDNRETDECISDEKIDQAINVMEETTRFFLEDRR